MNRKLPRWFTFFLLTFFWVPFILSAGAMSIGQDLGPEDTFGSDRAFVMMLAVCAFCFFMSIWFAVYDMFGGTKRHRTARPDINVGPKFKEAP